MTKKKHPEMASTQGKAIWRIEKVLYLVFAQNLR
jgi:hypothetical protein